MLGYCSCGTLVCTSERNDAIFASNFNLHIIAFTRTVVMSRISFGESLPAIRLPLARTRPCVSHVWDFLHDSSARIMELIHIGVLFQISYSLHVIAARGRQSLAVAQSDQFNSLAQHVVVEFDVTLCGSQIFMARKEC